MELHSARWLTKAGTSRWPPLLQCSLHITLNRQCPGLRFTAWQPVSQIGKQKMLVHLRPGFKSDRILFPLHFVGQSVSQSKARFFLMARMAKNLRLLFDNPLHFPKCVSLIPCKYRF